ncbi:MAG: hypothetical protein ACREAY_09015 [Nitrososphaera sp.]|uniref:hypothetical protein n=1 Tax=Nitrososphaera sp. TaxID=1971748 RepID=UPI003D6EC9C3
MKGLLVVAIMVSLLLTQQAAADPLNNAVTRQRIGNYDFEVALMPNPPVAGSPSSLMLRLAGVNGDDLIDVTVTLRLAKGGDEIYGIGPVIVPFGHYTLDYTFSEPGRYALYADLQDYAYSGETLTFTFLLDVAGPNDYLYTLVPGVGAAAAGAAGAIAVMRRRKKT